MSNLGKDSFYSWIAITLDKDGNKVPHYYIFHHTEINKFDDLSLDSYQVTDNQKTTLRINSNGNVLNTGKKHSYECFKEFHNNFDIIRSTIMNKRINRKTLKNSMGIIKFKYSRI